MSCEIGFSMSNLLEIEWKCVLYDANVLLVRPLDCAESINPSNASEMLSLCAFFIIILAITVPLECFKISTEFKRCRKSVLGNKKTLKPHSFKVFSLYGGDEEDRTLYLLNAMGVSARFFGS